MDRYIKRFKKQNHPPDLASPSTSTQSLEPLSHSFPETRPDPLPECGPLPSMSKEEDQGGNDSDDFSSSNEQRREKRKKIVSKRKYVQKYSTQWEIDYKWCQKSPSSNFAYCKLCNKEIRGNRSHLERHDKNSLHKKNVRLMSKVMPVDQVLKKTLSKNEHLIKEGEIKLAAFVAEHDISFNVMEHLPKLIQSICPDSDIAAGIKCSRTKTTGIINNVIGPYVSNAIIKDLNETFYSLIIDETTDISTKKCLAVLVRYFNTFNNKVVDRFLCLLELETGSTAVEIYDCFINYLNSAGIKIENMAGFAADNCATMMGQLNGVQALLKKRIPDVVVVGCTSHSFNLCSSYACSKIPKTVEDLVRDIYSHFSHSSKRIKAFEEFQTFCELKPHKILRPSETRWLSLQQAVDRVLEQYDALILYFTNFNHEEQSPKTDNILSALNKKINKMYLYFLSYILKVINNINIEFQSEKPRLHQLLPRISLTYRLILKNYLESDYVNKTDVNEIDITPRSSFLPLEKMYLGYQVQAIINSTQVNDIDRNELKEFRLNCLKFYIELASQIKERFPFGNELYAQLTWLDPQNIFSDAKAISIIPLVKKFPNMVNESQYEDINTEWRMLSDLPTNKFNVELDLEELVRELSSCKNALGEKSFPNLQEFLKNILCLPHGSAAAERIFSSLNLIKRKNRNCLDINTCHNLLLTKETIRGSTCCEWQPPSDMLKMKSFRK